MLCSKNVPKINIGYLILGNTDYPHNALDHFVKEYPKTRTEVENLATITNSSKELEKVSYNSYQEEPSTIKLNKEPIEETDSESTDSSGSFL